jgi:hypothetical protein
MTRILVITAAIAMAYPYVIYRCRYINFAKDAGNISDDRYSQIESVYEPPLQT